MAPTPQRTDLMSASRQPGEAPADQHGQGGAPEASAPRFPEREPISTRSTQRPNEPVTAGLPIGAGPGVSGVASMTPEQQSLLRIRAAAARRQSPTLFRLLQRLGG